MNTLVKKLDLNNSTELDIAKNYGEVSEIFIQAKRRNKIKEVCQKHAESAKSQEIALKSFLIVKQPQTILCFNYNVSYCKKIYILNIILKYFWHSRKYYFIVLHTSIQHCSTMQNTASTTVCLLLVMVLNF